MPVDWPRELERMEQWQIGDDLSPSRHPSEVGPVGVLVFAAICGLAGAAVMWLWLNW